MSKEENSEKKPVKPSIWDQTGGTEEVTKSDDSKKKNK